MGRRREEVELLRKQHPRLRHGSNYEWVVLEEVELVAGWNRTKTEVLFFLPLGFPETAPDNFYVSAGMRLEDDRMPGALNKNHLDHEGQKWDRFSWHIDGEWRSAADIHEGSNLLDFVRSIHKRLGEAN